MKVAKKLAFMRHASGTKFYEVVIFCCSSSNEFWTVRRWGRMVVAARKGGGETRVERHMSAIAAQRHSEEIIRSKKARDYVEEFSSFGLVTGISDIEADVFESRVISHYGDDGAALVEEMNLTSTKIRGAEADFIVLDELNSVPKPAPVRGDAWGSW